MCKAENLADDAPPPPLGAGGGTVRRVVKLMCSTGEFVLFSNLSATLLPNPLDAARGLCTYAVTRWCRSEPVESQELAFA